MTSLSSGPPSFAVLSPAQFFFVPVAVLWRPLFFLQRRCSIIFSASACVCLLVAISGAFPFLVAVSVVSGEIAEDSYVSAFLVRCFVIVPAFSLIYLFYAISFALHFACQQLFPYFISAQILVQLCCLMSAVIPKLPSFSNMLILISGICSCCWLNHSGCVCNNFRLSCTTKSFLPCI